MTPLAPPAGTLTTAEHLALDDAAIEACAAGGGPSIRFWSPSDRCLVFPPMFKARLDNPEIPAYLAAAGWSAVRRRTGGGMVPQGPGMLNVSLVLSAGMDTLSVQAGYHAVGDPIRAALATLGIETGFGEVAASFCDGRFNLGVRGRKICGLSQWRGAARGERAAVLLAHGVIIARDEPDAAAILNGVQQVAGDASRFDPATWTSLEAVAGAASVDQLHGALAAAFDASGPKSA